MASECAAAGAVTQKSPAGRGGGTPHLEPPLVERFAPGGSERYPLGERPHAAVANGGGQAGQQDRGQVNGYHTTERFSCQRFPDRYTPVQNLGSLDRYHTYTTLDRYCRTATPTDIRYHTLSTDRHNTNGRYTPMEKYQSGTTERHRHHHSHHQSAQNVCFAASESRRRNGSKQDVYKVRERSSSSDRQERQDREDRQTAGFHRMEQYVADRFPTIPCPERFATKEKPDHLFSVVPASSTPNSYLEPPSPAPVSASERRFAPPPPPMSPGHAHEDSTPSPDCFANNAFPSPTAQGGMVPTSAERFAPPPPLSPSPTEQQHHHHQQQRYAQAVSPKKLERYEKRYHHHQPQQQQQATSATTTGASAAAAAIAATATGDRFSHKERYQSYSERYPSVSYHTDKFVHNDNRYNSNSNNNGGERYVPPNAHTPVERYVPQPQEPYYGSSYQGYGFKYNSSDPYMRRDLAYHYRLSLPYTGSHYQRVRYMGTPNRMKCCQLQDYQLSKSSPGSTSSSSSVTSSHGKDLHQSKDICVQDIQCQNYPSYQQQEKAVQCGNIATQAQPQCMGYASPSMRTGNTAKGPQCRHSICSSPSVEYVGASGGRHVCATPPPRGSVGSDGGLCPQDACCAARRQSAITVAVWRAAAASSSQATPPAITPQHQPTQPPCMAPGDQQHSRSSSAQPPEPPPDEPPPSQAASRVQRTVSMPTPAHQRAVSDVPVGTPRAAHRTIDYSQSERLPNRERPALNRSISRKEIIKNYIKKETANFFGVDEENEKEQELRWLDRRKRMACRTMGPLKDEFCLPATFSRLRHRRAVSELASVPPGGSSQRPDVLPGRAGDFPDAATTAGAGTVLRRKDSVARMTWDGLSYVVTTLTRHRPRPRSQQSEWSRSYPPDTISTSAETPEEQTFFDEPAVTPALIGVEVGDGDTVDRGQYQFQPVAAELQPVAAYRDRYSGVTTHHHDRVWRREHEDVVLRHGEHRPHIGSSRILSNTLDNVLDNSNRRQYGMGLVGRLFGRSFRKSVAQDTKVQEQLDDMEDYRPMFTYWVTTVQILVLFISIICYGFGPFGIDMQTRSGQVLVTSLSLQQVDYMEPANFWFGPRANDLIHLGAKFAPCMRVDTKIKKEIDKIQAKERETACCIRNDDSGCVQSSQADCSLRGLRPTKTISTWKKWTMGEAGPGGRISGSVCGLDPKFCDAPASVHPYEWPDDITKWPICRKTNTQFSIQNRPKDKLAEHMVCEIIGHPCCIGIHGQCRITTKEYCDFVRGTFHEEASLCSQVSCLNDVCGMIPFYFPNVPDQFYRLWTSLFLHAGVLQLMVTVLIQYFLMRDLEKLTGSVRIGIIYIGSGVAGNLASAIFVPYRADVGPAGSQFGLLACLIVEVLNAWPMLKHPNQALCKLLSITLVLFFLGLLPWVDNYAHLFGFVFGFLLSYAFLPFISFGHYDRHKKIFLIWVCLASAWILFICLVLLFYIIPVYDCKICSYFNCLPLTRDFCASQNINFKREEPIV